MRRRPFETVRNHAMGYWCRGPEREVRGRSRAREVHGRLAPKARGSVRGREIGTRYVVCAGAAQRGVH